MISHFKLVVLLAVSTVSYCRYSGLRRDNYSTCDLTPSQLDSIIQDAKNKLQEENYLVMEGVMKFTVPANGSFYANPTSPYGSYFFNGSPLPIWKLNETDAMVFIGCTAPPAKYFSFRSYVFSTFDGLRPTIVAASLGDSTNHLVINTTGLPTNDPFGKATVVTSTADMTTDQAVREAFTAAGFPATAINTDIIPSSLVKMGGACLADTFTLLYRVAVFEDEQQGQAYINTTWPVLRVISRSQQPPAPFKTPSLKKRGNGVTESSYNSSLLKFLAAVDKTVKAEVNYTATIDRMSPVYLEGFKCIDQLTNCLGDNRDAAYMNSSKRYTLGENDPSFFIVCGLNHVKTGKATYINFAVGSVLAVDDSKFGGSARKYAPNMDNVDMFYAYKVTRNCNGEMFCLEVPMDKISERDEFNFIARAYLEPSTKVGPANEELLMPYVFYYSSERKAQLSL